MIVHIGQVIPNNSQIIPKLFGYDKYYNDLQQKQFQTNLEVSEVLIPCVTYRGKAG